MELTDLQIAANIKNKDIKTYEYIVDTYSKQAYYLAYNILHISSAKEDIEECVADAFFEVWTNIDKFDAERGSFRTWLFILVKYKALACKRKLMARQNIEINDFAAWNGGDIEKRIISRQTQEKIIDIISGFNKTDKELFIRRYFYNEKINDLAEMFNLTRSAVDNRLLRGRKLIKEGLTHD